MIRTTHSIPCAAALRAHVAAEYDLPLGEFRLIYEGGGAVYQTETALAKYVFKLSRAAMSDEARRAAEIGNFMRQAAFAVPEVVLTRGGTLVADVPMPEGLRCGVLLEYVEGARPKQDDFAAIGTLCAEFHAVMRDYDGELPLKFNQTSMADELEDALTSVSTNEGMIGDFVSVAKRLWDELSATPCGVIHGDFGVHNIIKGADGKLVLFDFDAVCRMPLIIDALILCNRDADISPDGLAKMRDALAAFMAGYNAVDPHFAINPDDLLKWLAVRHLKRLADSICSLRDADRMRAESFAEMVHSWLTEWKKLGEY